MTSRIAVKLLKIFDKDVDQINLSTTFKEIVPYLKAINIISPGVLGLFDSTHLSIDQLLGKAYFPEKPLHIFQLGSDQVEHLFRNVLTQNHAQNCDLYQLEGRLIRAAILDKIFIKHFDWKQKSVRLTGSR